MHDLTVTLVQCELVWESPDENRKLIADLIAKNQDKTDIFVLPEMFTTGFSMNALANAESPNGPTYAWLQQLARQYDVAITGSIAVREEQSVYNRMLFVSPDGISHYDKRHLFRMAGEHKRYASGTDRVIVNWRGWRVNLQVCYDLRFPVFSRNRNDYDLVIYVANWPAVRREHWRALLLARAIENQSCVVGVNRVGRDAKGWEYAGDSLAIAADGELLLDCKNENGTASVVLNGAAYEAYRESFPCHLDADGFSLSE